MPLAPSKGMGGGWPRGPKRQGPASGAPDREAMATRSHSATQTSATGEGLSDDPDGGGKDGKHTENRPNFALVGAPGFQVGFPLKGETQTYPGIPRPRRCAEPRPGSLEAVRPAWPVGALERTSGTGLGKDQGIARWKSAGALPQQMQKGAGPSQALSSRGSFAPRLEKVFRYPFGVQKLLLLFFQMVSRRAAPCRPAIASPRPLIRRSGLRPRAFSSPFAPR